MARKTYRVRLQLDGDIKPVTYRTDGVPTHCCSFQVDYFLWERNTKYNHYQAWTGYVDAGTIARAIKVYNPDGLSIH